MLSGGRAAVRRWASLELRSRRGAVAISPPLLSHFTTTTTTEDGGRSGRAAGTAGPPPIRVSLTESAGRGVFATRAIGAGDLIHTAQPLVSHPSPALLHGVCYYCLRRLGRGPSPLQGGDGTPSCYFCSERCRDLSKVYK